MSPTPAPPGTHPDYRATLERLYALLPMYQRQGPVAYKKDLGNIRALCQALGRPHLRFPCVHIAGTNGKGSVAHGLASVLQASGYRVGLYTSPHLVDFRERVRLDGEPVSEAEVVAFARRIDPQIRERQPSFFEVTVALAFERFAHHQVDIAVIETGLGGRLDSTNIVHPLVSVITSVGHDHQALLGPTLTHIAREKAGIIKPAVPVVIGAFLPETEPVFREVAERQRAPLYHAPQTVRLDNVRFGLDGLHADWHRPGQAPLEDLAFALAGEHQRDNLRCILQTGALLERHGFRIPDDAWRDGLARLRQRTGLRGRWDVLQREPWVLVDGAHNPEGLQALARQLALVPYRHLHVVTGSVADKDLDAVLPLHPPGTYYFARPDVPRGLDALTLRDRAAAHGLEGSVYPSIPAALDAALAAAAPDDAVLVTGSLFAVAEVPFGRWDAAPTPAAPRPRS